MTRRSGLLRLVVDDVVLRGDGEELSALSGLLIGSRGAERQVLIRIDPKGYQLTGFKRAAERAKGQPR